MNNELNIGDVCDEARKCAIAWGETNGLDMMNTMKLGIDIQQVVNAEKQKLQDFKDFVHRRLDEAGIPTHPDGEHSKAGCRIGDRLDIVLHQPKQ